MTSRPSAPLSREQIERFRQTMKSLDTAMAKVLPETRYKNADAVSYDDVCDMALAALSSETPARDAVLREVAMNYVAADKTVFEKWLDKEIKNAAPQGKVIPDSDFRTPALQQPPKGGSGTLEGSSDQAENPAAAAPFCNMGGGCAHSIKCKSQGRCEYPEKAASPNSNDATALVQRWYDLYGGSTLEIRAKYSEDKYAQGEMSVLDKDTEKFLGIDSQMAGV